MKVKMFQKNKLLKGCQKAYSITPFFFFFFFNLGPWRISSPTGRRSGLRIWIQILNTFSANCFLRVFLYLPKISLTFVKYMCFRSTSRGIPTKSTPFPLVAMCRTFFFSSWGEFLLEPEFTYFLLDIPICLPTFSWARQRLPRFFFIKSHYSCKTHLVWKDPDCSICAFVMSSLYLV